MPEIIYIQPIFAPDQMRLDRNLNSIKSFGNYTKKYPYNLTVVFGGWSMHEDYWPIINQTIKEYCGHLNPKIIKFDRNYGKAVIVNQLTQKYIESKHSYLLTADSDICWTEESPHNFERLVEMATKSLEVRQRPLGMISLNQKDQNCHLPCAYENRYEYDGKFGKETFVWPNGGGGIAGGCLFIPVSAWKKIGGYKVSGVYSSDDSIWMKDSFDQGYSTLLAHSISIIHPNEHDQKYAQFKVYVCQKTACRNLKNIDIEIAEMESFWKMHQK